MIIVGMERVRYGDPVKPYLRRPRMPGQHKVPGDQAQRHKLPGQVRLSLVRQVALIRQPASLTVVGLKPTYGRGFPFGLIAWFFLDQINLSLRLVTNAQLLNAKLFLVMIPRDSTSSPRSCARLGSSIGQDIKGMKIALP